MPGITACLLGNLDARRELGKVGTQSDLHLHDFKEGGKDITVLVPDRYPDKVPCLSYAILGSDCGVIVVDTIDAKLGEQILAASSAGLQQGAIVIRQEPNYIQPEQLTPFLKDTPLANWKLFAEEDWPAIREHLAACEPRTAGAVPDAAADVRVPVDHHFDVKGVGAVILGVVKQGTLKKGETLYAYPDKVICPVRSIQIHDADHNEAVPGDRVGLALRNTKADQLDRGMVLAPPETDLEVYKVGAELTFELARHPFAKQPLSEGSVAHLGVGMQFVPVRFQGDVPAAGATARVTVKLEKGLVVGPGERGVLWHVDSAPQRVVGGVTFS